MQEQANVIAPGARVIVRNAEWMVRKVSRTSTGGRSLTVIGISELVKDKESIFLDEIDKNIEVLKPVDTKLVSDPSSSYQKSFLYMESLLRQTPPTDENLYIGHKAAMDPVPYQLDPAIQALQQPCQRILIVEDLASIVELISPDTFSKYRKLLSVIQDRQHGFSWTGKAHDKRLVIFTERIETLNFLYDHLPKDLGLKDNQVEYLHGGMSDADQQRIVENFGKEGEPVRLLIASDVASEGINLQFRVFRG